MIGSKTYYNVIRFALTNLINILTSIISKQLFINNFTISLVLFSWSLTGFCSHHWNTIPDTFNSQRLKPSEIFTYLSKTMSFLWPEWTNSQTLITCPFSQVKAAILIRSSFMVSYSFTRFAIRESRNISMKLSAL